MIVWDFTRNENTCIHYNKELNIYSFFSFSIIIFIYIVLPRALNTFFYIIYNY